MSRLIALLLIFPVLTSCDFLEWEEYVVITPVDGFLKTPNGEYDFRKISEEEFLAYFPKPTAKSERSAIITAEGDGVRLFFCVTACRNNGNLMVASHKKNAIFKFFDHSYQYSNDLRSYNKRKYFSSEKEGEDHTIKLWSTINRYQKVGYYTTTGFPTYIMMDSEKLPPGSLHKIRFEFKLDSAHYKVAFSFRVSRKSRLKIEGGIPGI